ncbi:lachesin-like isoform X1 [Vespula maculifrons]|uniref:Ig-like domain-containing protein n=2 Tax=Vespula TaxID=7451 RepID=A0A834JUI0_VESVU|nr:hypothetical protein HZH66_008152 [Vespula vulgaris]
MACWIFERFIVVRLNTSVRSALYVVIYIRGFAAPRGRPFTYERHALVARISCSFLYLLVSWMRKRDMHILSAGILMYTSDLRFLVIHPENSENWTLQIKSPQERDSGVYECQVSTEPKMSLNYTLNVVGE